MDVSPPFSDTVSDSSRFRYAVFGFHVILRLLRPSRVALLRTGRLVSRLQALGPECTAAVSERFLRRPLLQAGAPSGIMEENRGLPCRKHQKAASGSFLMGRVLAHANQWAALTKDAAGRLRQGRIRGSRRAAGADGPWLPRGPARRSLVEHDAAGPKHLLTGDDRRVFHCPAAGNAETAAADCSAAAVGFV